MGRRNGDEREGENEEIGEGDGIGRSKGNEVRQV